MYLKDIAKGFYVKGTASEQLPVKIYVTQTNGEDYWKKVLYEGTVSQIPHKFLNQDWYVVQITRLAFFGGKSYLDRPEYNRPIAIQVI